MWLIRVVNSNMAQLFKQGLACSSGEWQRESISAQPPPPYPPPLGLYVCAQASHWRLFQPDCREQPRGWSFVTSQSVQRFQATLRHEVRQCNLKQIWWTPTVREIKCYTGSIAHALLYKKENLPGLCIFSPIKLHSISSSKSFVIHDSYGLNTANILNKVK